MAKKGGARRPTFTAQAARRKSKSQNKWLLVMALVVAALFMGAKYMVDREDERRTSVAADRVYGDLTKVITPAGITEEIIEYEGMTVSFNRTLHIPNWVSWELTADETKGDVQRPNTFYADENVVGCPETYDYSNTGYDRGHMAPAGDMKWSPEAMRESFYLTNIVPQSSDLNRGTWKKIEEKCRARAAKDSIIYIVCGPVPNEEPMGYIGETGVAVPRRLFKVVMSPYAEEPQAIGFIMDNANVSGGMQKVAVSVDEVERVTGYDFFSELPDSIENRLESEINFNRWSRLK